MSAFIVNGANLFSLGSGSGSQENMCIGRQYIMHINSHIINTYQDDVLCGIPYSKVENTQISFHIQMHHNKTRIHDVSCRRGSTIRICISTCVLDPRWCGGWF